MKTLLGIAVGFALLVGATTPSSAQDRWQAQLTSGKYLYDLQLVKLQDSSLVVRHEGKLLRLPVQDLVQLVAVQGTAQRRYAGAGAHDVVYQLTLLTTKERLQVLGELIARYGAQSP